ncbi:MAG: hypothetical protein RIS70_3840 [Planctomycetota bacterium]
MAGERQIVREVSWRDLFPWLLLFRTVGVATSFSVILLGTAAAMLTPLGWKLAHTAFLGSDPSAFASQTQGSEPEPLRESRPPTSVSSTNLPVSISGPEWMRGLPGGSSGPGLVYERMIAPGLECFSLAKISLMRWAYLVFGMLWNVVIAAVFGGAITRLGIMRLGREESVGVSASLRFAIKRFRAFMLAPLFPLVGVGLLSLPCALLGFVMRTDFGAALGGLFWFLVLIAGFGMAILLIGLAVGWPLMWGTISAEDDGDEFAAMQHSFSYTFQRPLRYAAYSVLLWLLGTVAAQVVGLVGQLVVHCSRWAVSIGTGSARWAEMNATVLDPADAAGGSMLRFAGMLLSFWEQTIGRAVEGFEYGFFWIAAAAVYLVLRYDVDRTEMDEVYCEGDQTPQMLPPLPEVQPASTKPE